mmetsp:Transcript_58454/g.68255  ORF Transcript_58454/g.68255 Transcript_58454/m.68255 type:complete len:577 (+) Transcript_58454:88-1818(+)
MIKGLYVLTFFGVALFNINAVHSSIRPITSRTILDCLQQDEGELDVDMNNIEADKYEDVQQHFFQQHLDHFASSSDANRGQDIFEQRFFYTDRYVQEAESSPVYSFLCVGGEGPSMDKSVLVDSAHCSGDMVELAKKLYNEENASVHMFALEHRYYGESYPHLPNEIHGSAVANRNLQYLSSRQAIRDISLFVSSISVENHDLLRDSFHFLPLLRNQHAAKGINENSEESVKWVTFGGSYPGMVAAWSRLLHPSLIHASVSNSAPVQAQLDFEGYNDVVASDLSYEAIGGSKECRSIVEDGHAMLGEALSSSSSNEQYRESISDMFNVCGGAKSLEKKKNVDTFIGTGVIYIPSQSNDPSCKGKLCNIEDLCSALLEEPTQSPMERLAYVSKLQRGDQCVSTDWELSMMALKSPIARIGGLRSWLWQTCNEFGFYQTCNVGSQCPYARGYHTVDQDLALCEYAFGISAEQVQENIESTLKYYGGWDLVDDRIFFINGDVDPWSALSVTTETAPDAVSQNLFPIMWVRGASHHFWTHAVKDDDSEEMVQSREVIYEQVSAWLKEKGIYSGVDRTSVA